MNTSDFMDRGEFVLKKNKRDYKFFDIFKLLFILFMFPYFILYRVFCNKISKMIFSKLFVILYIICVILLSVFIFNRITKSNVNGNEFEKIPVEFQDKIKDF